MTIVDISNPYIGPRPFQREEKRLFFGRDKDADKLLSMIIDNKIVILYAQSGAGKTSLINACMLDLLEEEEFKVLKIEKIGDDIGRKFNPQNIFLFNTLTHLNLKGSVHQELEKEDLSAFIKHNYKDLIENPFVIIFDQFEEIFTAHRDRWQDREGFFYEIEKLCENYPTSRIVFTMREDYIGYFDSFDHIWNVRPYYFRLDLLNKDGALSAIKNPAKFKKRKYDKDVAETIVQELLRSKFQDQEGQTKIIEGEFVEPVQLQIVCQKLWDSLNPHEEVITKDHLEVIGGVEKVLEDFYEAALHKALKEYPDKEQKLRNWIGKRLITPIETRGTVLYDKTEIGEIHGSMIESLRNSYLIRFEKRAGANWISLSHDRFIDPIIQSNQQWQLKTQQKKARKFKNLFYGLLISVSFIIPILIIIFHLYFSRSISIHEKALNDYLKGKQCFNEQNYEKAENYFLSSLQKEETEEASLLLAKTYKKLNEFTKAIDQFNKTTRLAPQSADTYYELGKFLLEHGEEDKGYGNFIEYFKLDKRSPRSVLPPNQYAGLIGYYFRSQINSTDSTQRCTALSFALELARQRVHYTYMGRSPEDGFDGAGFISYVLKKACILSNEESFNPEDIGCFEPTTKPQPMDLMFFPGANNTVLFYLGDFFGEKICIGIGLTAFIDIVNVGELNYAYSFYHINYLEIK